MRNIQYMTNESNGMSSSESQHNSVGQKSGVGLGSIDRDGDRPYYSTPRYVSNEQTVRSAMIEFMKDHGSALDSNADTPGSTRGRSDRKRKHQKKRRRKEKERANRKKRKLSEISNHINDYTQNTAIDAVNVPTGRLGLGQIQSPPRMSRRIHDRMDVQEDVDPELPASSILESDTLYMTDIARLGDRPDSAVITSDNTVHDNDAFLGDNVEMPSMGDGSNLFALFDVNESLDGESIGGSTHSVVEQAYAQALRKDKERLEALPKDRRRESAPASTPLQRPVVVVNPRSWTPPGEARSSSGDMPYHSSQDVMRSTWLVDHAKLIAPAFSVQNYQKSVVVRLNPIMYATEVPTGDFPRGYSSSISSSSEDAGKITTNSTETQSGLHPMLGFTSLSMTEETNPSSFRDFNNLPQISHQSSLLNQVEDIQDYMSVDNNLAPNTEPKADTLSEASHYESEVSGVLPADNDPILERDYIESAPEATASEWAPSEFSSLSERSPSPFERRRIARVNPTHAEQETNSPFQSSALSRYGTDEDPLLVFRGWMEKWNAEVNERLHQPRTPVRRKPYPKTVSSALLRESHRKQLRASMTQAELSELDSKRDPPASIPAKRKISDHEVFSSATLRQRHRAQMMATSQADLKLHSEQGSQISTRASSPEDAASSIVEETIAVAPLSVKPSRTHQHKEPSLRRQDIIHKPTVVDVCAVAGTSPSERLGPPHPRPTRLGHTSTTCKGQNNILSRHGKENSEDQTLPDNSISSMNLTSLLPSPRTGFQTRGDGILKRMWASLWSSSQDDKNSSTHEETISSDDHLRVTSQGAPASSAELKDPVDDNLTDGELHAIIDDNIALMNPYTPT